MELESSVEKTAGNNLATFEDQFGFCAQKKGADFEHPPCGGQTDTCAPCLTKDMHEVAVRQRIGRGKVDGPGNILSLDEEFDSADEVRLMDP